jgi:N-acetylmuramoyl-L-alanine amidase
MRAGHRAAAAALCALAASAAAAPRVRAPLVLLDPGHTAGDPGAIGIRGVAEVEYDDALVALLAPRLERAGFRVAVSRAPGEEIDLATRAERARGAWLLLSVHHDSAQPQLLVQEEREGRPAFRALEPIRGWSLFVSAANGRPGASLRAARALGRRLLALGRPPTLHHARPIPGEGRTLLDRRLGIYRRDDLAVLRQAPCPAVLLEAGVLVDPVDEAWLSDPARRAALADAVVAALLDLRGR